MRWDNLFDDLETQLEQGLNAEEDDLHAEEERLRLGRLSLRERIVSVRDSYERRADYSLRFLLISGESVPVRPATVGRDWLSGDIRDGSAARRQCILPLTAIAGMSLTREQVRRSLAPSERATEATLATRLSVAFVLRDLCRRRVSLEIVTVAGSAFGTIDRVGRDHLDLAVHEPGQPRREGAVSEYRAVALAHLAMVRL
ncbi:hypothetical protein BH11ACT2_BH11ACT2_08130 [soil metagenome]